MRFGDARQAHVVAEAAKIDREPLLRWVLAYAGLFAAWFVSDKDDDKATGSLAVVIVAANKIGQATSDLRRN